MNGFRRIAALIFLLLAACSPMAATAPPLPKATPTATPFQVEATTAESAEISSWLSPGLPSELGSAAQSIETLNGRSLRWVGQSSDAELRFEANAETPITNWTYVVRFLLIAWKQDYRLRMLHLPSGDRGSGSW